MTYLITACQIGWNAGCNTLYYSLSQMCDRMCDTNWQQTEGLMDHSTLPWSYIWPLPEMGCWVLLFRSFGCSRPSNQGASAKFSTFIPSKHAKFTTYWVGVLRAWWCVWIPQIEQNQCLEVWVWKVYSFSSFLPLITSKFLRSTQAKTAYFLLHIEQEHLCTCSIPFGSVRFISTAPQWQANNAEFSISFPLSSNQKVID